MYNIILRFGDNGPIPACHYIIIIIFTDGTSKRFERIIDCAAQIITQLFIRSGDRAVDGLYGRGWRGSVNIYLELTSLGIVYVMLQLKPKICKF